MRKVGAAMQSYWGSFAGSADPNAAGTHPAWPRWRAATQQTLLLAEAPEAQDDYLGDTCDFWDKLCGDTACFGPGP